MQSENTIVNGKRFVTSEYRSWQEMRRRILDPKRSNYKYYGGRGIRICKRWNRYENFLIDMGRKPTSKHSLDRKNNNGNYCKSNCRWATHHEQGQNRCIVKLTSQKVEEIRKKYFEENTKQTELAKQYNVAQITISRVVRGITWTNQKGKTNNWNCGRNINHSEETRKNRSRAQLGKKLSDRHRQAISLGLHHHYGKT